MNIVTRHPWVRWGAPVVALALVGAVSVAGSLAASADPTLPPRTPSQLVADVLGARLTGMSGTVVQSADLGLPQIALPGGSRGSARLDSITSGTHTWRVWYAGPDQQRVALLGNGGESDLIHDGTNLWVWSSTEQKATHYTVPARTGKATTPTATDLATALPTDLATELPKSPQEAAERILALVDPTTEVTAPGTTTVAGRAAYHLVLTPRDRDSLVASIRIAVDAETKVPLRVQVMSTRITTPAIEVGFTSVDFTTPEARMFAFTPPPGTTVVEGGSPAAMLPGGASRPGTPPTPTPPTATPTKPETRPAPTGSAGRPTVTGSGWGAVVVSPAGLLTLPGGLGGTATSAPTTAPAPGAPATRGPGDTDTLTRLLGGLPRISGDWGSGRVLAGTLFTVVLTDDGRVALGAVGTDRVVAALAAR